MLEGYLNDKIMMFILLTANLINFILILFNLCYFQLPAIYQSNSTPVDFFSLMLNLSVELVSCGTTFGLSILFLFFSRVNYFNKDSVPLMALLSYFVLPYATVSH